VTILPVLLLLGSLDPTCLLRWTVYIYLAAPIYPLLQRLGVLYRDKPFLLSFPAAVVTGLIWATAIYLLLCLIRRFTSSKSNRSNLA
jgi:hypothetical protein